MNPWDALFVCGDHSDTEQQLPMRLVRKHGRPLLIVPLANQVAARCLELFPAQTAKARLAKHILRLLWKSGLRTKMEPVRLPFDSHTKFSKYIATIAGHSTSNAPAKFGILLGNPAGDTQRFLVLVFNDGNLPVAVVKAGLTPGARSLVRAESEFLSRVSGNVPAIPRLISKFESSSLDAFSTDYCAGDSPRKADPRKISDLLTSWLNPREQRSMDQFPEIVAAKQFFGQTKDSAGARMLKTCVQHGDFAPWNIKVSDQGAWTVLDWERGTFKGVPGWDWFHYEIQTAILVEKCATEELIRRIKQLIASEDFKKYAREAGIDGVEKPMLLAYLRNLVEVIKPAEGLTESQALLQALAGHTF